MNEVVFCAIENMNNECWISVKFCSVYLFLGVFNQPDKGYSLLQKVLIRRDDTKVGLLVRLKGSREGET